MRWAWALLVLGALLLAPSVRADPALSSPGPGLGLAVWTFSNPQDYAMSNAALTSAGATLAWRSGSCTDTSAADFSMASSLTNINLTSAPGDVVIADTTKAGPVQNLTFQPGPSPMADNFLYAGNGGRPNFGNYTYLHVGNNGGGEWTRAVLQFPALPLPAGATLLGAHLDLYFFQPITTNSMDFSVHRVTSTWTESGSSWDNRDVGILWNTTGGDFDPTVLDTVAGVGVTPGWFSWNVTTLVQGWWTKTIVNQGLMVRQVSDTGLALGEKGFYSSDDSNATLRPRLELAYKAPGATGRLVSRACDAGSTAAWGTVGWNATVPAGTAVAVRTRSGNTYPADASWSGWSAPYGAAGSRILSPPGRYLEYAVDLSTTSATSPALHDLTVTFGHYAASGFVTTGDLAPAFLQGWDRFTLNASTSPGTSVVAAYSQDGGGSWLPVAAVQNLSSALVRPIRLRAVLTTTNTTSSPVVVSLSLSYRTASQGGTDSGAGPFPWWILLLVPLGVLGLVAYRRFGPGHFVPLALFLIHADGRLVTSVGREETMRDELATSAMLTLVLQFVKDAFQDSAGSGGELQSLQVDRRTVSIAKGDFLYMAVVSEGDLPATLPRRMVRFLQGLEGAYASRVRTWDGLRKSLGGLEGDAAWFLHRGYRRGRVDAPGRYHP